MMVNSTEGALDLYLWLYCDQVLKALKCILIEEIYVGERSVSLYANVGGLVNPKSR
jgi:hypothetical protein